MESVERRRSSRPSTGDKSGSGFSFEKLTSGTGRIKGAIQQRTQCAVWSSKIHGASNNHTICLQ